VTVRFSLEDAAGDTLTFEGRLAAQVSYASARASDSLLIARMFVTAAGHWVLQIDSRTWDRGGISWSAAWSHATRDAAQRDATRRLSAWPFAARVLFERLGWPQEPRTEPPAAAGASQLQNS
jgi:hypothetical protein